jgi:predicted enzyme related to lactoylglutathione lyase
MPERNDYPPGVPCWVDMLQPDAQAAARFYGELMGWTFEGPGTMPGNPPGQYFVARLDGRDVAGIGSRPSKGRKSSAARSWCRSSTFRDSDRRSWLTHRAQCSA